MTISTHTIEHVRVESPKGFAEVARDFERQLGTYDPTVLQAGGGELPRRENAQARLEALVGPSGFLLFGTTDQGGLMSLFRGTKKQARQYVLGNPLIALEMTQYNLAAGL
jgi:hypothetical protein